MPTTTSLFELTAQTFKFKDVDEVTLMSSPIQSVNLRERRIITSSRTLDYDYLVIDQTPSFSADELVAVRQQLTTLLAGLQAAATAKKKLRARVYCQGSTAEAWQLALLIKADIKNHYPRLSSSVEVLIDLPGGHLADFLRREGLKAATANRLKEPGFSVHAPSTSVSNRRIRGLRLDGSGHAIVGANYSPIGFGNVIVIDSPDRQQISLLRVIQAQARQIAAELINQLDGSDRRELALASPALWLRGTGNYVALGTGEYRRTRARLIAGLDRRLWRSLV